MAIEHLQAGKINAATAHSNNAGPSTWAAKWDMWCRRVVASGWVLLMLKELFDLERSVTGSSWIIRVDIAAPLFLGVIAAFEVWKARRDGQMEEGIADKVLTSLLFIVWFAYLGMLDLGHSGVIDLQHYAR